MIRAAAKEGTAPKVFTPLRTFSPTARGDTTPRLPSPSGTFFQFRAAAKAHTTPKVGPPLRTFSPTAIGDTTPNVVPPSGTFATDTPDRGNT